MTLKQSFDILGNSTNINEFISKHPLAIAMINTNKEIIAYNRAFFMLAGRELRQGVHHCYEFMNFPFCQTNCLADIATKSKRSINGDESKGKRKNGEEIFVRPMVTPLFNEENELKGHILVFQDTTDEVHLYQNFRENLEHLERKVTFLQTLNYLAEEFQKTSHVETLIDKIVNYTVNHLLVECCQFIQENQEGELVNVSDAFHSKFELTEEQLSQLGSSILPGIEYLKQNTSSSYHLMNFAQTSGNSSVFFQKASAVFHIRSGNSQYGYLVFHQLSTPSIGNAEQLEYLDLFSKSIGPYIENSHIISNLESIVEKRSLELQATQAELVESTRLASVGEMAGMVAHEVLNPMTALLAKVRKLKEEEGSVHLMQIIAEAWEEEYQEGGIETLLQSFSEKPEGSDIPLLEEDILNIKESANEIMNDLQFIEDQLNRVVSIVDNLRGLSRSRNEVNFVEINQIIEKLEQLTKEELRKRNIQMITEKQNQLFGYCDPNELLQVLHNLVKNSIQAMEKDGTITVTVTQNNNRIEIRVRDSGPGIPLEVASKIFEMRFTTKAASEGTGIGLNLSRRLMRQIHGDVLLEVRGGEGSGAVFLCWFPQRKTDSSSEEISTSNDD